MSELKATDLRLNNLVNLTDKVKKELFQVTDVCLDEPHFKVSGVNRGVVYIYESHLETLEQEVYYEDIQPIPLDEEWLEMFGFKRQQMSMEFWTLRDKGITFQIAKKTKKADYVFRMTGMTVMYCTHVHTLQNIYHALTGEELTLKEKDSSRSKQ